MKGLFTLIACLALLGIAGNAPAADKAQRKLQHVVAFKFKSGVTPEQIKAMEKEFRALKDKIPGIIAFEHGTDNSPEGKAKGFTHCYILSFKDEKSRNDYLPHPEHKAFGKIVGPLLEDVFVIDFWAN
ncbi:MAG: Dabb family protein [Verrucomicrobiota bacterium]